MTSKTYDFIGRNGDRAVVYAASARGGRRLELGLQVYNPKTFTWVKVLFTQLLPNDFVGVSFELQRLVDKAHDYGFTPINRGKSIIVGAGAR